MDINWMGRYRQLVETLVRHRNAFARVMNNKTENYEGISVSILEWEVLEYIIEHENDDSSMSQLSSRLCIPPSSLFKLSKTLCDYGLVAKYQMVGNKKNVILKPTEKGLDYYIKRAELLNDSIFGKFFDELSEFNDEQLEHITRAIDILTPLTDNNSNSGSDKPSFIKID